MYFSSGYMYFFQFSFGYVIRMSIFKFLNYKPPTIHITSAQTEILAKRIDSLIILC